MQSIRRRTQVRAVKYQRRERAAALNNKLKLMIHQRRQAVPRRINLKRTRHQLLIIKHRVIVNKVNHLQRINRKKRRNSHLIMPLGLITRQLILKQQRITLQQ